MFLKLNKQFQNYWNQTPKENLTINIYQINDKKEKIVIKKEITNPLSSYFLAGNFGSGKTQKAIQIARKAKEKLLSQEIDYITSDYVDYQSNFITFFDYHELVIKSINNTEASQEIKQLKECKILILDDMSLTHWSESKVDQLINLVKYRQENYLQTIFTSNKGLQELSKEIPAVTSRILIMCGIENCLLFEDRDYRLQKIGQKTSFELELENQEKAKSQVIDDIEEVIDNTNVLSEEEIEEEKIWEEIKIKNELMENYFSELFNINPLFRSKVITQREIANETGIPLYQYIINNQSANCLIAMGMLKGFVLSKIKTQIQLNLEASKLTDEQVVKEEQKTSQNESERSKNTLKETAQEIIKQIKQIKL